MCFNQHGSLPWPFASTFYAFAETRLQTVKAMEAFPGSDGLTQNTMRPKTAFTRPLHPLLHSDIGLVEEHQFQTVDD